MPDTTESSRATPDALFEAISQARHRPATAGPQALEMQVGLRVSAKGSRTPRNPAKIARFANTPTWAVQHCQASHKVGRPTPMVAPSVRGIAATDYRQQRAPRIKVAEPR